MISGYLRSIRMGLQSLVFDNSCIVCRLGQSEFCRNCQSEWRGTNQQILGENFTLYSSIAYNETAAKIVLLAKEGGIGFAENLIVHEIKSSVKNLWKSKLEIPTKVLLVPIPSSRRARIRRGGDFISKISRLAAKELNLECGDYRFVSHRILSVRRRVLDQSLLSESQREANLSGAFVVTRDLFTESPIIIIDDVVTTGSTLREAVRALKERNLTVLGAVTACASQRRLPIR
jgi:predicted amidophosphoribosyltransferase